MTFNPPQLDMERPVNGVDEDPAIGWTVGEYIIVRLRGNDEFSKQIFPAFLERAMGFLERTHSDTDSVWLGWLLHKAMFENLDQVMLLAAIDTDGKIVAHVIAYPEQYQKLGVILNLLQVEKDADAPNELVQRGNEIMDAWARERGVKDIINSTSTMAHVRLFEEYGYKLYRYVTRKTL